jgi:RNA polymerase sigma-B factor
MALRVAGASHELSAQTGRAPRVQTLAEYLEVSVEDVLIGLEAGSAHYADSLDAPAPGMNPEPGESQTLGDSLGENDDGFELIDSALSGGRDPSAALPRAERSACG